MKWTKRGTETTVKEVFMRNINVASTDQANEWFRKSYDDAYTVNELDEAVELAKQYKNKTVTIVGDYDADGCTATSILYLTLKKAGFQDVRIRIPKRFTEGYGLNPVIIDEIDTGLVITVDNGISQLDAIKKAHDKGLKVIILDHHLPYVNAEGDVEYPEADIIIDPNAVPDSASFCGYCGAGLAYKFARKMHADDKKFVASMCVLAAIGTIADVMPLREENYVIVRRGLAMMTDPSVCPNGLMALLSELKLDDSNMPITASDVGFLIAPCINAASRMADNGAKEAVHLLISSGTTASILAQEFVEINAKRKEAKAEGIAAAEQTIADDCLFGNCPLIVYVPGTGEGIIGIIAGNLAEHYGVPAIVLTDSDSETLKGSARSAGDYNMKEHLDMAKEFLLKYGGHPGAAGLSLKKDQLQNFYNKMQEVSADFSPLDLESGMYDLEINEKDVPDICEQVMKYGPYGEGNPAPVFKVTHFLMLPDAGKFAKQLGDGSIVKLTSNDCTAVGFNNAGKDLIDINCPTKVTLYGTIAMDRYSRTPQVEYVDVQVEDYTEKAPRMSSLAERLRKAAAGEW